MNQIQKNTVAADNQLKDSGYIKFIDMNNTGRRIMFLGNSITLHGIAPGIGWLNEWGMAASDKSRDYVHILKEKFKTKFDQPAFCICQGSKWETDYTNRDDIYPQYESARRFGADIIIMRLIENVPQKNFDADIFEKELEAYLEFLSDGKNPQIVFTTSFWKHCGNDAIRKLAARKGCPVIELSDLGEDDSMKAIGLFEHSGVANHPGDKGMQAIADRIFDVF